MLLQELEALLNKQKKVDPKYFDNMAKILEAIVSFLSADSQPTQNKNSNLSESKVIEIQTIQRQMRQEKREKIALWTIVALTGVGIVLTASLVLAGGFGGGAALGALNNLASEGFTVLFPMFMVAVPGAGLIDKAVRNISRTSEIATKQKQLASAATSFLTSQSPGVSAHSQDSKANRSPF